MNIMRLMALPFLTTAILSALPAAQAQTPSNDQSASSGLPPSMIRITALPPGAPDLVREEAGRNAFNAIAHGEALLKKGKTEMAIRCYKDAMTYEPDDPLALQRIAEAYALSNRLGEASQTYHHLFHEARWQGVGGNATVYLGYALVLAKTGQAQEAVKFYQEGARRLNYMDGKQNLKVLLPMFDASADSLPYTPQRLQALAETGIAHEEMAFGSNKEGLAHLQDAVRLYPDSPVVYFYLGEQISRMQEKGAKAAYARAAALGNAQVGEAAQEALKNCR